MKDKEVDKSADFSCFGECPLNAFPVSQPGVPSKVFNTDSTEHQKRLGGKDQKTSNTKRLLLEVLAGIAMSTKVGSLLESTIPHCQNMKFETSSFLETLV